MAPWPVTMNAVAYLTWLLLLVGAVLLVVGYRRNQRRTLAIAAIVLLLAGSADQIIGGFVAGIHESIAEWARV